MRINGKTGGRGACMFGNESIERNKVQEYIRTFINHCISMYKSGST